MEAPERIAAQVGLVGSVGLVRLGPLSGSHRDGHSLAVH